MRFIIILFGVLSHFTAVIPHAATNACFGQLAAAGWSASAHADEAQSCRI